MPTYERVTYRPEGGGRGRSVMLQDVREATVGGAAIVTGTLVDRDGDLVAPSRAALAAGGAVDGSVLHVIEESLVVRREPFEMDLFYATLVPRGTAQQPIRA
jgi:hypothetical protein